MTRREPHVVRMFWLSLNLKGLSFQTVDLPHASRELTCYFEWRNRAVIKICV